MSPESANSLGLRARIPLSPLSDLEVHAKMDSSLDFSMIALCSRKNASLPSPYRSGMFTPNKPSRQYDRSSSRVVFLLAAQLIRFAMLASDMSMADRRWS